MIIFASIVLIFGIVLLISVSFFRKRFSIPSGSVLYSDSQKLPGELLYARTIPLVGKPDFILKKGRDIVPVEIKRGKTPTQPYRNHIAQLYAYCLLVKENYNARPAYGVIKYPEKEFELEFPAGTEERLTQAVVEMVEKKKDGISRNGLTKVCKQCRTHR